MMREDSPKIWYYDTEIKENVKRGDEDTVFNMEMKSNPLMHKVRNGKNRITTHYNSSSIIGGHNVVNVSFNHYEIKYI